MKKILGMLLILSTLVCVLAFTFSVDAVGDGEADGDGYYTITSQDDLLKFASAPAKYKNANIKVTYTGILTISGNPLFNDYANYFTGTFDGGEATFVYSAVKSRAGLFGYAGNGATIKNVKVRANIEGSAVSDVGGIVAIGLAGLTIEDCQVLSGSSIKGASNVGGIIGRYRNATSTETGATLTIKNCSVDANVSGTSKVGGIIGYLHFEQTGLTDGSFVNLINVDKSGSTTSSSTNVGGLVGHIYVQRMDNKVNVTIDADSSNSGEVKSDVTGANTANVGGLVGNVAITGTAGSAAVDISISGTNNGTIGSGSGNRVGGIVGVLDVTATYGGKKTFTIGGKNNGEVKGTNHVGGAVGYANISGNKEVSFTVSTTNNGTVSGSTQVGGLVAYASFANTASTATFTANGSNNENEIKGTDQNCGGIVGKLEVKGAGNVTATVSASNSGAISGSASAGGAIGAVELANTAGTSSVTVSGNSTGNVSTISTNGAGGAGGSVGYLRISNAGGNANFEVTSDNQGNITATTDYAGGIIGRVLLSGAGASKVDIGADVKAIFAGGNTIKGTQHVGGAVGYIECNKAGAIVNICAGTEDNNTVVETTSGNNAGGVVGLISVMAKCNISLIAKDSDRCSGQGTIKSKAENAGGLVGAVAFSNSVNGATVEFKGSAAYHLINRGEITAENNAGGMVGLIKFQGSAINNDVEFNYCDNGDDTEPTINATTANAGGIIGSIQALSGAGTGNSVTVGTDVQSCSGTVDSPSHAGGIIGYSYSVVADSCDVTVNGTNKATVGTANSNYVGGIIGHVDHTSGNTLTLDTSVNSGTVRGKENVGGIVGAFNSSNGGAGNVTLQNLENKGEVSASSLAGGIIGFLGLGNGDVQVAISGCENSGKIEASHTVGGIVGRFETSTAAGSSPWSVEYCKNSGDVSSTVTGQDSRAGGIIGMFYQKAENAGLEFKLSSCWNTGNVSGHHHSNGGIIGWLATSSDNVATVEYCLNEGDVNTTYTGTEVNTGGIIGNNYFNRNAKQINLNYCYNAGNVTAGSAAYVGPIVGRVASDGGDKYKTSGYDTPTSVNSDYGTQISKFDFVSQDNPSITNNWVYSQKDDIIELEYFHNNHTKLPDYRWGVSGNNICYYCESINCPEILGTAAKSDISEVVYVSSDGYTVSTANPAQLGSREYPANTLELANSCVERNKLANVSATKIVVLDTVTVPADYHLPEATSDIMVLTGKNDETGENTGVLYFGVNSKPTYSIMGHFHIDGDTLIENIEVLASDTQGICFYADGHDLEMGYGITMSNINPDIQYVTEDRYATANSESPYKFVGARVYVIGGSSINEMLHEKLITDGKLTEFNDYLVNVTSYVEKGIEALTDEEIETISGYVDELSKIELDPVNSNITVRSGDYRSISGWHSEPYFRNDGSGDYNEITYKTGVTGTANITVGSQNEGDLRITHVSPYGYDYQSYGKDCTANVTVNGNVEVWNFNVAPQVPPAGLLGSGSVKTIGIHSYPVITNISLAGNITGPTIAEDSNITAPSSYYWGFICGGYKDYAVLANATVDASKPEAVKDAHAFLGHEPLKVYCADGEECTCIYPAATFENYAHREAFLVEKVCDDDCINSGTTSEPGLSASCITYPMVRNICVDCKGYKSAEVLVTDFSPNNHIYSMSLSYLEHLRGVEDGVEVTEHEEDSCSCNKSRTYTIENPNGIFYVKEVSFNVSSEIPPYAKADLFEDGIGTELNPFNDFMTAYRVAVAYSKDNGKQAKIVIIDNASLIVDGNTKAPYTGSFDSEMGKFGDVVVEGKTPESELIFRNIPGEDEAVFLITGDLEIKNLTLAAPVARRIRIFARNNKLVMGEGITMKDAFETPKEAIDNVFMLFGGFYSDPGYSNGVNRYDTTMDTNLTVRSGQYYYIGAWNNQAVADAKTERDGKVTGKGKITVGTQNDSDTLVTHFLSAYGVGAETTVDTEVNMTIDGEIDVYSLEPTAQNGTTDYSDGASTEGTRITNIRIKKDADIDIFGVHTNGEKIRGNYVVNVFVEKPAENHQSIDTVHKLCGHDKGLIDADGDTNYRHINTYHTICDKKDCRVTSDPSSYLYNSADVLGVPSNIDVNVYDMEKGVPNIEYRIDYLVDSGCYYKENRDTLDRLGGVVRFLFALVPYSDNCDTLDPQYADGLIEKSYVSFLFSPNTDDKAFDKTGDAAVFSADIYDIQQGEETDVEYYAVGVVNLKGGRTIISDTIATTRVNWDRKVQYSRDIVGGGVEA